MSQPPKTLVRAPQWLGDAVVSTYFLDRLKKRFPNSAVVVAAPAYLRDLYTAHPAVSEFVALPLRHEAGVSETARRLRAVEAEKIYILPRSFRTALESWLARIPERIGFKGDFRSFLLTHFFSYKTALSYPNRYLALIGEEDFSVEGLRPFFPKADLNLDSASEKFKFSSSALQNPILGIGPASIAPSRTWPVDRFISVAKRHVKETGGSVLLFGSEREIPITRSIQEIVGASAIDTAGKLGLPELGWFVSQCQRFVCNDSGLMHVAAAFGIPTIVVFGASDPTYALPRTGKFYAIQKTEIDCVPCLRNHCVRFGDMHLACLNQVSDDEVWNELAKH